MKPKVYILIADRSAARLFVQNTLNSSPVLENSWKFPRGRLKNRDINSDRPGRSYSSHGWGSSPLLKKQNPVDRVRLETALQLAHTLNTLHLKHPQAHFVVAAESKFLGDIKKDLSHSLVMHFFHGIAKDLGKASDKKVFENLHPYIMEALGIFYEPPEAV